MTKLLESRLPELVHLLLFREVTLHGDRGAAGGVNRLDRRRQRAGHAEVAFIHRARSGHDLDASLREHRRNIGPNATARAGNNRHLAGEILVRRHLLPHGSKGALFSAVSIIGLETVLRADRTFRRRRSRRHARRVTIAEHTHQRRGLSRSLNRLTTIRTRRDVPVA